MAKMMGELKEWFSTRGYMKSNSAIRHEEDEQWTEEAMQELYDFVHENGICHNFKTGMAGCEWCYGDDDYGDGWFGDLEGREGITYNGKEVVDPWGELE